MALSLVKMFARAKVNLALAVAGLRPDGYHELQSVMQTIALHDVVILRRQGQGIVCRCGRLSGSANLAYRAVESFLAKIGKLGEGIEIEIDKNIPVEAGLAGGSADAAAALRGVNLLFGEPLSFNDLVEIGNEVGSDVPFCLAGGTQWVTGRGDGLAALPPVPQFELVVAKPHQGVNTGAAYREFDRRGTGSRLDRQVWEEVCRAGHREEIAALLLNDLEEPAQVLVPEIGVLKERLLKAGCLGALMSGSGSSVFGIARSWEHAQEVAAGLAADGLAVWVTSTHPGADAIQASS